jgi:hypothetical protein
VIASERRSIGQFAALLGVLVLVQILVPITTIGPAAAEFPPSQRSVNIAGGLGTNRSVSSQASFSASSVWNHIHATVALFGADWPQMVGVQEACWSNPSPTQSNSGGAIEDPLGYLIIRLRFATGDQVTWVFNDENGLANGNASNPLCYWFGNAVISRANSPTAVWRNTNAAKNYPYEWQCDGSRVFPYCNGLDSSRPRQLNCVYPNVWVGRWVACSTHMTHTVDVEASWQVRDMLDRLSTYVWPGNNYQTWIAGDMNIGSTQPFPTGYGFPAGYMMQPAYNTLVEGCGGPLGGPTHGDGKIDYLFSRHGAASGGCNIADAGNSDHDMITSFIE